jgi:hypothetical protein
MIKSNNEYFCGVEGNPSSMCIALNTDVNKCDKYGAKLRTKKCYGRDRGIAVIIPCKKCKIIYKLLK